MAERLEESVSSPRQKFHAVFQPKQGRFPEFPPSRISEMMKSNSVDNAPTQSLLSVVNGILDESIKGQNGGIPDRVACLLRKVVQEIERRISTQAEHIRNQNNLFKAREEKYQSRIKVLETLATGTSAAAHAEKTKVKEKKVKEDQDLVRLMKEKEDSDLTILKLKKELEVMNKSREEHFHQLEVMVKEATKELMLEKEESDLIIAKLKAEMEVKTKSLEHTLESKIQEATRDLVKEKESSELMVMQLKEEVEQNKRLLERNNIQFEAKIKEITEKWARDKENNDQVVSKLEMDMETKGESHDPHRQQLDKEAKDAVEKLLQEKEDWNLIVEKLNAEIEMKNKSLEQLHTLLEIKNRETTEETMKGKEDSDLVVTKFKEKIETMNRLHEQQRLQLESQIKEYKEEISRLKQACDLEVSKLRSEIETKNKLHDEISRLKQAGDLKASKLTAEIETRNELHDEISRLKQAGDLEVSKLMAEIETKNKLQEEISRLKQAGDLQVSKLMAEIETNNKLQEEISRLKQAGDLQVSKLMAEIETKNKLHDEICTLKQAGDLEVSKLMAEIETKNKLYDEISRLKQAGDLEVSKLMAEIETKNKLHNEISRLKQAGDLEISTLMAEIETKNKLHDQQSFELTSKLNEARNQLEEKKKELQENKSESEFAIAELRKRCKELEELSNTRLQNWQAKENVYRKYVGYQLQALQDLRMTSSSIKSEVRETQKSWHEEYATLGRKLKELAGAAETCHMVLAENRRLYNEVQELKGNIRVFCRIRPFLPGEIGKLSTVDYIGENGELLIVNPSKQGKDGHRMFKFNKVFGPQASQGEVYLDTQPLIRSSLDGFNVCIFAYGQTGSGKTYTMSGPTSATKENWGVNYRALNDLFDISQSRSNAFNYEIDVQMVEIYNEQVRDLLSHDASQKRLEIRSTSQPSGLAVPDASMFPVKSTNDVLELMQVGQTNRAMSATALNERSSRSHSVLSIHVRGTDLKTGASLRGCLHLVDLAGSERVDRSEVTGERLREAQHINKSLSALGDVVYSLSQKSSHVPYRNSKLTQLLQTSLGGHAKTLMFVQVNPDMDSYSETLSTLKFAERASGIELGAAKSSKEGKDAKELMEQVAHLKDIIATRDEEIERLHILKELKNQNPQEITELLGNNALNHSLSSPSLHHLGNMDKVSDMDPQSMDNFQFQSKTASRLKSPLGEITSRNPEERLSSIEEEDYDVSEADILGGNPDNLEAKKTADIAKVKVQSQSPRSPTQRTRLTALTPTKLKESPKSPLSPRRTVTSQTSASKSSPSSKRRQ